MDASPKNFTTQPTRREGEESHKFFSYFHTQDLFIYFGKGKEQCDGASSNIFYKCLRHFIRVNGTLA
jgi:hypothetical protein